MLIFIEYGNHEYGYFEVSSIKKCNNNTKTGVHVTANADVKETIKTLTGIKRICLLLNDSSTTIYSDKDKGDI